MRDDATPEPSPHRWLESSPEAANLIWLGGREPRFPRPGRYRVLLLAFTDLPVSERGRPIHWTAETVMSGPDLPRPQISTSSRVRSGYRLVTFVYEYAASTAHEEGDFIPPSRASLAAIAHMRRSGLAALAVE